MYNDMRSVDLFDDHDGCSNDPEHEGQDRSQVLGTLLAETLDDAQEQSFAQVNQKRRRLAFQAFSDPLLMQKTLGMESLVKTKHTSHGFTLRKDAIDSKVGMAT